MKASTSLAPDDRLPKRDLLLDANEVARRLSASLGIAKPLAIESCERVRTKYRYGQSLRVLHRIRVSREDYLMAARMFARGTSQRSYEAAMKKAIACGPLRPITHDPEIGTVFWTFPNDRKIAVLEALINPPDDLKAMLPEWTRSRLVAYAPEKCATAECLDDHGRVVAYAKIYAGDEGPRIQAIYTQLQQVLKSRSAEVQAPRLLGYSERNRLLLLEAIKGGPVSSLTGYLRLNAYRSLGITLARLHSLPLPVGLLSSERLSIERLRDAARIIGVARPDVRRAVSNVIGELAVMDQTANDAPAFLHGDPHPKNGILSNGQLTLIDLDQAGVGPAAVDLGGVLAGLSYSQRTGALSRSEKETLSDNFLAGYSSVRRLPKSDCLHWHTAAALVQERALRPVTRVRLAGLGYLREVLTEAFNVLQMEAMV